MNYTQSRPSRHTSRQRSQDYAYPPHRHGQRNRPQRHGRFGNGGGHIRGGGRKRNTSTFDVSRFINRNPAPPAVEAPYVPKHRFEDFNLSAPLLSAIKAARLHTPTPIQDEIIEHILARRDVVGLANTGTGKTAAFLIPLIERTLKKQTRRTLILTPTRELAIQIEQELKKLTAGMRLYSAVCVGGVNINPQIRALARQTHFVVGTPGRVLDLIDRGALKTADISTVVLDEADRMLDMGFIGDMRKILKHIPIGRHTLFFSATMSKNIEAVIHDFLRDPVVVSVRKKDITDNIAQDVLACGGKDKFSILVDLLQQKEEYGRVLLFGRMKHHVEKLSRQLAAHGIAAESIHGNKSHPQRQRALARFKEGHAQVLVATDVASRGIHVENVTHVINYDLPATYEDYVHRIGRTGRGRHQGKALTFVE